MQDTCHYLDDFLIISSTKEQCQDGLDTVIHCATQCGFKIKETKTVGPTQKIEFLGITIDTLNRSLYMSKERMHDVKEELQGWYGKKYCSKRDLLSLIGRLQYCSQVVQYGSMFIRRLIKLSTTVKSLHNRVYLNEQCRKDINWWLRNMDINNCKSWFPVSFNMETAEVLLTDASGYAAAAVWGEHWTVQWFDGEFSWIKNKSIAFKELYAIVLGISTFAMGLKKKQVVVNTDNMSIYHCLESGKSRDSDIMGLIRSLYYYSSVNNIQYMTVHVPGITHRVPDSLSRNRVAEFFTLVPNADRSMTRPCRLITDF